MVCIYCGKKTHVINSRLSKRSNSTWRRRRCPDCNSIFTTHETTDLSSAIMIEKLDSSLEPFSRPKLFASIYDACKHLPQPAQMADDLTTTVVKHILTSKSAVLSQKDLKALISTTLSRFDAAAGVQYDAYHR